MLDLSLKQKADVQKLQYAAIYIQSLATVNSIITTIFIQLIWLDTIFGQTNKYQLVHNITI